MKFDVFYNTSTHEVQIEVDGTAAPAGFVSQGKFDHPELDLLGPVVNHVMYHHVREVLYPKGLWNLQIIKIATGPSMFKEVTFFGGNTTLDVPLNDSADNVQFYTPADAYNKALIVEVSDGNVARAEYIGPTPQSGQGRTIRVYGLRPGKSIVTAYTTDGSRLVSSFEVTVK